ncbi:hypothetical protein KM043_002399 [Ampulex compressa]|nr:hypothetical protein KM043_002399 [Ampulex compressa]
MELRIVLLAFVTAAIAEEVKIGRLPRAPQGQIRYNDPDGTKVNWKFFAPQTQWQEHLENSQRAQRAEASQSQHTQVQAHQQPHQQAQQQAYQQIQQQAYQPAHQPAYQQAHHQSHQQPQPQPQTVQPQPAQAQPQIHPNFNQIQYQPYSAVPSQIKQLISQTYAPQKAYVDPSSLIYDSHYFAPQQYEQQSASAIAEVAHQLAPEYQGEHKLQARRDYLGKGEQQGAIEYREEYEQQPQQQQHQHQQQAPEHHQSQQQVLLPVETPLPRLILDKGMPSEIQQLLQYQSRIPYDVIANRIQYKPRAFFVPKPLPEDAKGPYNYRSKVYYVNDEEVESDYQPRKPVEENQRH